MEKMSKKNLNQVKNDPIDFQDLTESLSKQLVVHQKKSRLKKSKKNLDQIGKIRKKSELNKE